MQSTAIDLSGPVDVGHFKVEREIGKGGFGKVMAVQMREADKSKGAARKFLAMKIIAKDTVIDRNQVDEIYTERDLLVNLRHDFICNAFYAFSDAQNLYLVLDLALGGDLNYQLKFNKGGKPFTESRTRFYFVQIAAAVEYLHKQSFIHRDIKPANILMDSKGYLKLTDFGISRKLDKNYECVASSGTKVYMAPEVLKKGHKHGKASDWYSLGMTLHEWLFRFPAKLDPKTRKPLIGVRDDKNQPQPDKKIAKKESDEEIKKKNVDISEGCMQMLEGLLKCDPESRIGFNGISQVRSHKWVSERPDFSWNSIINGTAPAPFLPDTSKVNADMLGEVFEMLAGPAPEPKRRKLTPQEQLLFQHYSYDFTKAKPTRRESRMVSTRQKTSQRFDQGEAGVEMAERSKSIHEGIRTISRKLVESLSKGRDSLLPMNAALTEFDYIEDEFTDL